MQLTKHHGLGNDFLVVVDLDGRHRVDEAVARALCDRRRGIGADGIIHVTAGGPGADVTMVLRNADGGRAEMSGNGIRCLAQAVRMAGAVPAGASLAVATDAGIRRVEIRKDLDDRTIEASVDMGPAAVGAPVSSAVAERGVTVDVGNPHVVLLVDDPSTAPVHQVGHTLDHDTPGGTNVEFVRVATAVADGTAAGADRRATAEGDVVELRVWERGVGETEACGTGACAAVAATAAWGLTAPVATVRMPGGSVTVEVDDGLATLTGPAAFVAAVEVPDA